MLPKHGCRVRHCLYKVGVWLKRHHPEVTQPQQWTRELGLEWVTAIDHMKVGDYVTCPSQFPRLGQPLLPRSKDSYLGAMRAFFRDLQEWEWIPRRFDPGRLFATPRSIKALIGPAPRTISDDIWARIMWAGLNLTSEDLFSSTGGPLLPPRIRQGIGGDMALCRAPQRRDRTITIGMHPLAAG